MPFGAHHRYINREDINFENVDSIKPTQEWTLAENDANGELEYPTTYVNVHLSLPFGKKQNAHMCLNDLPSGF